MTHWRIVTDRYCGFEVQSWRWWWPFWIQGATNTHSSIELAEAYANKKASWRPRKVVKLLGELSSEDR